MTKQPDNPTTDDLELWLLRLHNEPQNWTVKQVLEYITTNYYPKSEAVLKSEASKVRSAYDTSVDTFHYWQQGADIPNSKLYKATKEVEFAIDEHGNMVHLNILHLHTGASQVELVKHHLSNTDSFSNFVTNATKEEKELVLKKAADAAIEEQNKLMEDLVGHFDWAIDYLQKRRAEIFGKEDTPNGE